MTIDLEFGTTTSESSRLAIESAGYTSRGRGLCQRLVHWTTMAVTLAGVVVLMLAGPAKALFGAYQQSANIQCSIQGTVKDASGAPVSGATVTLRTESLGVRATTRTAGQGQFVFGALEPGRYTIEIESAGFKKSLRSNVMVDGSHRTRRADFLLVSSPGRIENEASTTHPSATGGRAAANTLDRFEYDDQAAFKPSGVETATDAAGYSSAREVDSYSMMLDYLKAEDYSPSETKSSARHTMATETAAADLGSWGTQAGILSEGDFLTRGSNLMLAHNPAAATETFRAGISRFPDSLKLATALGIALSARGDSKAAIVSLLRATDLKPDDPQSYFVLAKAYMASSEPNTQVLERLQRLAVVEPRDAQAQYYYSLALIKESKSNLQFLPKAESLLRNALMLDPGLVDAHLQLGSLYAARANYGNAIREYEYAVRLNPALATAHYRLARAYSHTGNTAAARREMNEYQRLRGPAMGNAH